ncbi:bifunctional PIG-L family deacetylase/class I SAM-dependent methyltransferase [Amycolatopsis acidicola]|uniref:Bifunctional PIG-L family deacetylase/class I SAM-dependent methyltransferase n=1 Tax=Amycolatopsis acidicola TaxID=2596893 RepID=A0A5N0UQW0_9PSEU|nr:bifunctional PIG-L family deacetylase/class I SAM-dependent methyltransferase [Amycolatopsis acidicola]KAA9152761.1 bifunctional PIG-L family deacetylase/class I SAM-dependent methyltransferase [Amycolatopsis acidicola]
MKPLDLRGIRRATIVAAHPDDETLGAAGLIQRLHAEGVEISLVIATDGEAAFPRSDSGERRRLASVRRAELADSLAALGVHDVEPVWLGLPDSGLHERGEQLRSALTELLRGSDLCLAPWPGDPHPDHCETGLAMLRAAPEGAQRWSYPIWMWHWLEPDEIPWQRAFSLTLTEQERTAKAGAIKAFTSQTSAGPHGEEPILPPEVLTHFDRPDEIFFREPRRESASPQRFAELYRASPDPWETGKRWYERRKRAVALAALPREHYGTILEPACGNGNLTRELAVRCDRLVAFDPVAEAVEAARAAVAGLSHVEVSRAALPEGLSTDADLVVHSEILYYLSDADLGETIRRSVSVLRPGGHLLAVHWKPWAPEAPRDGWDAHQRLIDHPDLEPLVAHDDEEFVLHVLKRR